MLQNCGCNAKSTLLELKDGDKIVLKSYTRIEFIFACKIYTNFSIFLFSDFTKKHNTFTVFKIFHSSFAFIMLI